jgi:hypothetical protein
VLSQIFGPFRSWNEFSKLQHPYYLKRFENFARQSNGCATATAIVYRDASNGEASTGLAIVSRCGSLTCSTGWGGTARRITERSAQDSMSLTALGNLQISEMPNAGITRNSGTVDPLVDRALSLALQSFEE